MTQPPITSTVQAKESLSSTDGELLDQVSALTARLAQGENLSRQHVDAIALRHQLHQAGLFDVEEDLMLAAIAQEGQSPLATTRHRFYLASLCITQQRFHEAAAHLDEIAIRVDESAPAPEAAYWRRMLLGERHYLEVGRTELYRGLGLLGRAATHLGRARLAKTAFEEFLKEEGRVLPPAREAFQLTLEIDFELGRMRYDAALDLIERARSTQAFQGANRYQLVKRMAAALDEIGLQRADSSGEAILFLEQVALASGDLERLANVDRIDACFRLVRQQASRSLAVEAKRWSAKARELNEEVGPGPPVLGAELLAAMDLDAYLADRDRPSSDELDTRWSLAMEKRLQAWARSPIRLGGHGMLHYDKARYTIHVGVQSALRTEGAEGGPVAAFARVAKPLQVSDFARRLGLASRTVTEQQAALRDGELALLVFPGTTTGHGFVVTNHEIQHFVSGQLHTVRRAADELRMAIEYGTPNAGAGAATLETASTQAWDALGGTGIGLRRQLIEAETVFFLAADLTYELPLEALLVDGSLLGERVCISHLPNLDLLCQLRGAPAPALARATVIADVPFDGWDDPLERGHPSIRIGSRRAGNWLNAAHLPGDLALGEEGTVDAILEGALDHTDLVIAFAHGDQTNDLDRPASLVLGSRIGIGGDGRLDSSKIEQIRGPAAALLAACSAGTGPQALGGGGGNHLGGAFIASGSKSVILGSGRLGANASANLVDAWCEELGRGATIGEALCRARQAARLHPSTSNPYHVAGLRLMGLPELRVVARGAPAATYRPEHSRGAPSFVKSLPELTRSPLAWAAVAALAFMAILFRRTSRKPHG